MKKRQKPLHNSKEKTAEEPKTLDKHTAKFIAVLAENLPRIDVDVMEGWIKNPKALQRALSESLCPPSRKNTVIFPGNNYLKLLSVDDELIADACEDEVFEKADNVFTHIDPDFKRWEANEKQKATPDTPFGVYELQKDGTFQDFFTSVGQKLDSMCFTHGQVRSIVKKYRNWLRTEGYGNFFLFKSKGKFFRCCS